MTPRHSQRRAACDQMWEDALLATFDLWTVADPDVPGLGGERLLAVIVEESTNAMERLKAKGMLDVDDA